MTELVSYDDRMTRMISSTLNMITTHCHPVLLDPVVLCTPKAAALLCLSCHSVKCVSVQMASYDITRHTCRWVLKADHSTLS
jgi:hypothetical protein